MGGITLRIWYKSLIVMESGYSWVFHVYSKDLQVGPLVLKARGALFLVYVSTATANGECYEGYVQFAFKTSEKSLMEDYPMYRWMKSVNDPEVYAGYLQKALSPIIIGNPRMKMPQVPNPFGSLSKIKKSSKNYISKKVANTLMKYSLDTLPDVQFPNL